MTSQIPLVSWFATIAQQWPDPLAVNYPLPYYSESSPGTLTAGTSAQTLGDGYSAEVGGFATPLQNAQAFLNWYISTRNPLFNVQAWGATINTDPKAPPAGTFSPSEAMPVDPNAITPVFNPVTGWGQSYPTQYGDSAISYDSSTQIVTQQYTPDTGGLMDFFAPIIVFAGAIATAGTISALIAPEATSLTAATTFGSEGVFAPAAPETATGVTGASSAIDTSAIEQQLVQQQAEQQTLEQTITQTMYPSDIPDIHTPSAPQTTDAPTTQEPPQLKIPSPMDAAKAALTPLLKLLQSSGGAAQPRTLIPGATGQPVTVASGGLFGDTGGMGLPLLAAGLLLIAIVAKRK